MSYVSPSREECSRIQKETGGNSSFSATQYWFFLLLSFQFVGGNVWLLGFWATLPPPPYFFPPIRLCCRQVQYYHPPFLFAKQIRESTFIPSIRKPNNKIDYKERYSKKGHTLFSPVWNTWEKSERGLFPQFAYQIFCILHSKIFSLGYFSRFIVRQTGVGSGKKPNYYNQNLEGRLRLFATFSNLYSGRAMNVGSGEGPVNGPSLLLSLWHKYRRRRKGKGGENRGRKSFLFSSLAVSCMHDYKWGPSCEKKEENAQA